MLLYKEQQANVRGTQDFGRGNQPPAVDPESRGGSGWERYAALCRAAPRHAGTTPTALVSRAVPCRAVPLHSVLFCLVPCAYHRRRRRGGRGRRRPRPRPSVSVCAYVFVCVRVCCVVCARCCPGCVVCVARWIIITVIFMAIDSSNHLSNSTGVSIKGVLSFAFEVAFPSSRLTLEQ